MAFASALREALGSSSTSSGLYPNVTISDDPSRVTVHAAGKPDQALDGGATLYVFYTPSPNDPPMKAEYGFRVDLNETDFATPLELRR